MHNILDRGINERRDANHAHMVAYSAAATRGFGKLLERCDGKEQLHLWALFTHPDFRDAARAPSLSDGAKKSRQGEVVVF
jgi:hypothetical protein